MKFLATALPCPSAECLKPVERCAEIPFAVIHTRFPDDTIHAERALSSTAPSGALGTPHRTRAYVVDRFLVNLRTSRKRRTEYDQCNRGSFDWSAATQAAGAFRVPRVCSGREQPQGDERGEVPGTDVTANEDQALSMRRRAPRRHRMKADSQRSSHRDLQTIARPVRALTECHRRTSQARHRPANSRVKR
jgi:hypothetical protein